MGETCEVCQRVKGTGFERCQREDRGQSIDNERCYRTGYYRSQEALAAARRDLSRWPTVVREYVEHVGAAMPNEGDIGCAECDALLGLLAAPAAAAGEDSK